MTDNSKANDNDVTRDEESLGEALGDVRQSLMRVAGSVVRLPISVLPEESRNHFDKAGQEFSRGISSLLRSVADGMERADDNDAKPQG